MVMVMESRSSDGTAGNRLCEVWNCSQCEIWEREKDDGDKWMQMQMQMQMIAGKK